MARAYAMSRLASALMGTAWMAATVAGAGDSKQAVDLLEHKGLARRGATYVLPAESSLIDGFRAITDLQRKLREAQEAKARVDDQTRAIDREIEALTSQRRQLSDQLPRLAKDDPKRHNQAVAEINQISVRLAELY